MPPKKGVARVVRKAKTPASAPPHPRFPIFPFAFNANTVHEIRAALNPTQLARLPHLDELTFQALDPTAPSSPIALVVGHFVCPNEDRPRLGAPLYAVLDALAVRDALAKNPATYYDVLGDESVWPRFLRDVDEVRESYDSKKRAALKDQYPCDEFIQYPGWYWSVYNGVELEAQVLWCFLLGWEAGVVPALTPQGEREGANENLLDVLRELCDRDVNTQAPYDAVVTTSAFQGPYVVPRWRAGERLTQQQRKSRRDWSGILSRSIAARGSEITVMERSHALLGALPDAGPPQLTALGLNLRKFRGAKRNLDALGEVIERNRGKVQKWMEDRDSVDGQLPTLPPPQ